MSELSTNKGADNEYITQSAAARLLGVTSPTMKRFPIPYRQYVERGKCFYRKSEVLQFKERSINQPT